MKKKLLTLMLVSAAVWIGVMPASAINVVDNVYQITSADEFIEFAELVNGGQSGIDAVLTADVDFTGKTWTPIGSSTDNAYHGTFNGQFHKVSNLVCSQESSSYIGLFGRVTAGAVIKNLIIDGSCYFYGNTYVAGIAAAAVGNGGIIKFENCGNEAMVKAGSRLGAGIFGSSESGSHTVKINNCYNGGQVTGQSDMAAIAANSGAYYESKSFVTNCLNYGEVSGNTSGYPLWTSDKFTGSNNYDIYESGQATLITDQLAKSGAVAYALNHGNPDGIWHQTIDGTSTDSYPTFDATHGKVYATVSTNCDGSAVEGATLAYSNTASAEATHASHAYTDGVCSVCGDLQDDFVPYNNGAYEISTAAQLNWFALKTHGSATDINARLMADIDFSQFTAQGNSGTQIGANDNNYGGTFDGQGHTITVDYSMDSDAALFRRIAGGTIKNLIVDGTITCAGSFAGGVFAQSKGNELIENCCVMATINIGIHGGTSGGFGGTCANGTKINYCSFVGTFNNSGSGNGGFVGWGNGESSSITNSLLAFTYKVPEDGDERNNYGSTSELVSRYTPAVSNVRYVNLGGDFSMISLAQRNGAPYTTEATLEQMATGELAYLLNGSSTEDVHWYQNIDAEGAEIDDFPTPIANGHAAVYPVGELYCDGTSKEGAITYSNTNASVRDAHDYVNGFCSNCGIAQSDFLKKVDGYYQISTPEELKWFAQYVNSGKNNSNAQILEDIDFSEYSAEGLQIGTNTYPYNGIFDGKGHTITFDLTLTEDDGNNAAPFYSIDGATIKNLIIDGQISGAYSFNGGLFGTANASLVQNVVVKATVSVTSEKGGTSGGFGGTCAGGTVLDNCAFLGTFNNIGSGNGGFVGWGNGTGNTLKNCLLAATFRMPDNETEIGSQSELLSRYTPAVNNIYYVNTGGDFSKISLAGRNGEAKEVTMEQVMSGEICYLLNGSRSDSVAWYQNIDAEEYETDEYPTPFADGHSKVYPNGTLYCDGKTPVSEIETTYSNTANTTILPHEMEEGICSYCHLIDDTYFTPNEDGIYEISTAEQLRWFTYKVNAGNPALNAVLVGDIDFSSYTLADSLMIGTTEENSYSGTFDGQGHSITVNYNKTTMYTALFRNVNGSTIKNLQMKGSIVSGYAAASVACFVNGTSTFENIVSEVNLSGTFQTTEETPVVNAAFGGITVNAKGNTKFTNCGYAGKISTNGLGNGGICSYASGGSSIIMQNCYVAATFDLNFDDDSTSCVFARHNPSLVDCYYIDNEYIQVVDGQTKITAEEVSSGALCFTLNNLVNGDSTWTQTLGEDAYPLPFKGHGLVFATGEIRCDGGASENTVFANEAGEYTQADHVYGDDGICEYCGLHLISTAAQLYALAEAIQYGQITMPVNATLTADIDMSEYDNFIGIGTTEIPYMGTFDGQFHRIKNLTINDPETDARGLFNYIAGGTTIKNLIMDKTCSVTAKRYAAAVAGKSAASESAYIRFENVANEGTVTGKGINAAGIFGCNNSGAVLYMTNCYNSGLIDGTDQSAALTGWTGEGAHITNCYNSGVINGIYSNWTLYRFYAGQVEATNCFEVLQNGMKATQVSEVSADQVKSGELCYLLNGSVSGGTTFFQTIGEDEHPTFLSTRGIVYGNNGFFANDEEAVGIDGAKATILSGAKKIYTTDGIEVTTLQKGVNIVRENGTVKKVLVK